MKSQRPPLLLILIFLGLLGCFFNMIMVLSPAARNVSAWYPLYLSLSSIYAAVCLGGMGLMRKFAVPAYSFYFVVHQAVHLALGHWNGFALALPAALTLAGWAYYRRMD